MSRRTGRLPDQYTACKLGSLHCIDHVSLAILADAFFGPHMGKLKQSALHQQILLRQGILCIHWHHSQHLSACVATTHAYSSSPRSPHWILCLVNSAEIVPRLHKEKLSRIHFNSQLGSFRKPNVEAYSIELSSLILLLRSSGHICPYSTNPPARIKLSSRQCTCIAYSCRAQMHSFHGEQTIANLL